MQGGDCVPLRGPSTPLDLVSLGTLMQLQPNAKRSQFRVAFDRLNDKITGRWASLSYAPIVLDAERAFIESAAQLDLNDPTLVIRGGVVLDLTLSPINPIEPEYIPVYYIEPFHAINKVGAGEIHANEHAGTLFVNHLLLAMCCTICLSHQFHARHTSSFAARS